MCVQHCSVVSHAIMISYWFTFSFMWLGPWKRQGQCVAIVLRSFQQKKNGHALFMLLTCHIGHDFCLLLMEIVQAFITLYLLFILLCSLTSVKLTLININILMLLLFILK